jgi:hypothetical protein
MLGERITCGKRGNRINAESRIINTETQRTQGKKTEWINTENTKQKEETHCLTIKEGRNKLSTCGNFWSDCFKSIF